MDISNIKSSFLDHINHARTNPSNYAEKIYEQLAPKFHDDELHCFQKVIQTAEGIEALDDLTRHMKKAQATEALLCSEPLSRVAQRIAQEKGLNGRTDHETPQAIYDRISLQVAVSGSLGELIALRTQGGEETATYFLVDDGLATRKRRRMLLDPKYRFIGIGSANHIFHENIVVVLLAEQVSELIGSQISEDVRARGSLESRPMRDMGHSVGNSYFRQTNGPEGSLN